MPRAYNRSQRGGWHGFLALRNVSVVAAGNVGGLAERKEIRPASRSVGDLISPAAQAAGFS